MDTADIQIRYEWHPETCRWNYSIVDVIDSVIDSADARNYWKVMKNRLKKRDNQIALACNQLKMRARDGKLYNTDTADAHTILQLVRLLSDSPLHHIERWITIVESTIPQQKPERILILRKSFPQVRKLNVAMASKMIKRNRLKNFFGMKLVR